MPSSSGSAGRAVGWIRSTMSVTLRRSVRGSWHCLRRALGVEKAGDLVLHLEAMIVGDSEETVGEDPEVLEGERTDLEERT